MQITSKSPEAIKVEGLSKAFSSQSSVLSRILMMMRLGFGLSIKKDSHEKLFWALKNISFEVKKGEAFGIIGRNGAGKSTLLQIIAGTLSPTMGSVKVHGRVNALLELGSGFNPEFTGRENVYLNGSILGFSKTFIETKMDEIIDFSELREFIDFPVKTYSSGMFVRLAFSVQALLEPDILIVDEALSVGDVFFVQKCHDKIEKMLKKGNITFLFVTHDLGAIEKYCDRALTLQNGEVIFCGDKKNAIAKFYRPSVIIEESSDKKTLILKDPKKSAKAEVESFQFKDESGNIRHSIFQTGEEIKISLNFKVLEHIIEPIVSFTIKDYRGIPIYSVNNVMMRKSLIEKMIINRSFSVLIKVSNSLSPGNYTISSGFTDLGYKLNPKEVNKISPEDFQSEISYENFLQFSVTQNDQELPRFYGIVDLDISMDLSINASI